MDKMGERLIQESIRTLLENQVQRKPQFICALVIGISVKVITFKVIY